MRHCQPPPVATVGQAPDGAINTVRRRSAAGRRACPSQGPTPRAGLAGKDKVARWDEAQARLPLHVRKSIILRLLYVVLSHPPPRNARCGCHDEALRSATESPQSPTGENPPTNCSLPPRSTAQSPMAEDAFPFAGPRKSAACTPRAPARADLLESNGYGLLAMAKSIDHAVRNAIGEPLFCVFFWTTASRWRATGQITNSSDLAKDLTGDLDGGIGVGPSCVKRQVRDELDEFLGGHSVLKGKFQMER